jgi:hypothetical protein
LLFLVTSYSTKRERGMIRCYQDSNKNTNNSHDPRHIGNPTPRVNKQKSNQSINHEKLKLQEKIKRTS